MAKKAPTYQVRDFYLQQQRRPVAEPLDTSGLRRIGRALIERGIEQKIAEAEERGIREQNEAGGADLIQEEVGFFGRRSAQAANQSRRTAFGIMKKQEMTEAVNSLITKHDLDPDGFKQAITDPTFRSKILGDIHVKDLPAFQNELNRLGNVGFSAIKKEREAQDKADELNVLAQEAESFRTQMALETEQNGFVSDETLTKREAFFEAAHLSDVSAATLQSWRVADDIATNKSKAIHGYRSASDKAAYIKSITAEDGPFKNIAYDDRLSIKASLNNEVGELKAQRTAAIKVLRDVLTDARSTELSGRKSSITEAQIQTAAAYPELAPQLMNLSQAIAVREEVHNRGNIPAKELERVYAEERDSITARGTGYTPLERALEEGTQKLIDENRKYAKDDNQLGLAHIRGQVTLEPAGADGSLADPAKRVSDVERARYFGGQGVPFYTAEEVDAFQDTWEQGTNDERKTLISNLTNSVPRNELFGVLRQVSKKDPQLSYIAALASNPSKLAQRLVPKVLDGLDFAENNPQSVPKQTDIKSRLQTILAPYMPLDTRGRTLDALSTSAFGLYVSKLRTAQKLGKDSSQLAKEAAFEILGIEKEWNLNGRPVVPFEFGMSRDAMRQTYDAITEDDLAGMNGDTLPVDNMGTSQREITLEEIQDKASLVYLGPGKYGFSMPSAADDGTFFMLQNPKTKQPYIYDYNAHKDRLRHVPIPAPTLEVQ